MKPVMRERTKTPMRLERPEPEPPLETPPPPYPPPRSRLFLGRVNGPSDRPATVGRPPPSPPVKPLNPSIGSLQVQFMLPPPIVGPPKFPGSSETEVLMMVSARRLIKCFTVTSLPPTLKACSTRSLLDLSGWHLTEDPFLFTDTPVDASPFHLMLYWQVKLVPEASTTLLSWKLFHLCAEAEATRRMRGSNLSAMLGKAL